MKCKEVMQEVSDFLDGELDEAAKEHLCEHLRKCHKCQVVVDTTRKTIELYCDGKLYPLPDPVRERLHQTLRSKCQGHAK